MALWVVRQKWFSIDRVWLDRVIEVFPLNALNNGIIIAYKKAPEKNNSAWFTLSYQLDAREFLHPNQNQSTYANAVRLRTINGC
jgi:hypothetical protein